MKLRPTINYAPETGDGASLDTIADTLILQRPEKVAKEVPPAAARAAAKAEAEKPALDQILAEEPTENELAKPDPDDDLTYLDEKAKEQAESDEKEPEGDDENVDIDELDIDVTIDGEVKPVKLKDLKANYSGNQAIERRLQEATEAKTVAYRQGVALYEALGATAQRLNAFDQILQRQAEPEVNWEEMRLKDPARYLIEKDKVRDAEAKRAQIQREQAVVNQRRAELEAMAQQEYAADETRKLVQRMPEIIDPERNKEIMQDFAHAAEFYGYDPAELDAVIDHRHIMVLADAAKYRRLLARKAEAKAKVIPAQIKPLLRPSSGQQSRPNTQAANARKALIAQARKSGKVDDVAKLLMVKKK